MTRRPPRSTLFPYTTALPIFRRGRELVAQGILHLEVSCTEPPPRIRQRRVHDPAYVRRGERLQHIDPCPGEQGVVEFEGRRSEEHTSELQSHVNLVCRLLLEK